MSDLTGKRQNRGGRRIVPKGSISKHVVSHNLSHDSRVQLIKGLLGDKIEQDGAKSLEPGGAAKFVELLDELLNTGSLDEGWRSTCVRYLARVCGWHRILPKSVQISDYQRVSQYSGGGSSTVWAGTRGDQEIVVKALTLYESYDEKKKQELTRGFCKEVVIWKYLDHPNVLKFIGAMMVTEPGEEKYEIISEFMENGEIGTFIKKNQEVNRLELLKDVAAGLSYLHSKSVVHGDLKGANILINKHQRACLVDFGLTRVLAEHASTGPLEPGGTRFYMSPELLYPDPKSKDKRSTKESDVYALGIVIYEVICGDPPHLGLKESTAAEKIVDGEFPQRPSVGFTDSLWKTLEDCLHREPRMRPSADDVLKKLNAASRA